MSMLLETTFRDVPKTEAIESLIQEKAARLETVCDHIISCRVAVEQPHHHQQTGRAYRVRIVARVPPGHELVVSRGPGANGVHEGAEKVVHDAFESLRRKLRKLAEQQRGEVKVSANRQTEALVVRLFPENGYGFLKTENGREIYFHRNSVADDEFDRLKIGTGVRFVEKMGEEGPQASTVQILSKPRTDGRISRADQSEVEPPPGWRP